MRLKLYRPGSGLGKRTSLSDFLGGGAQQYQKIAPEYVDADWSKLYADAKIHCSHGPKCKAAKSALGCTVGKREQAKMIVSGAVLPFWSQVRDCATPRLLTLSHAFARLLTPSLPFWSQIQAAVGYDYRTTGQSSRAQTKKVSRMRIVRVRYNAADGTEQVRSPALSRLRPPAPAVSFLL